MRAARPVIALLVAAAIVLVGAAPGQAATKTYKDKKKDVSKAGLDIRSVKVTNTKKKIKVVVKLDGSAKKYRYPNGSVEITLNTTKKKGPEFGLFLYLRGDSFAGPMVGGVIVDRERWNGYDPTGPLCIRTMSSQVDERLRSVEFTITKNAECLGKPKKVGVNVTTYNTGAYGKKYYKKPKADYFPKKNKFTKKIGQS